MARVNAIIAVLLLATLQLSLVPKTVQAEEARLPEVVVSDTRDAKEPLFSEPSPTPKTTITKEGIKLFGGAGQTSLYAPADLSPSVLVESPDPFGVSTNRNINIRGKSDFHLAKNIMGVPLAAIVGGADMVDLENLDRLDVYRGGIAANTGLGASNAAGVLDQIIQGPRDKFNLFAKQGYGSLDFHKTFMRVDSGKLTESGTKFFVSGSTLGADKWKGSGDETRDSMMLGVSQDFGSAVKLDWYGLYNKFKGNTYRTLTWTQTQNLKDNYKYDYNPSLTGVAATDVNYYKFNKNEQENVATLANLEATVAEGHKFVFKPYFWTSNGISYSASGTKVQKWYQQNDNLGGVAEYQSKFSTGTDVTLGYWGQRMTAPPPPTDQRQYTVTASGDLAWSAWGTLAKIDPFIFSSPYAQVSQSIDKTTLSGGMRFMDFGAPRMRYYNTAGLPNVSYDKVWDYNPTENTNAHVSAKNYQEWLPNLGVKQELNSEWSVSLSYARKFGRPDWGPQASNFITNQAAFLAKGVTLQTLVDKVRPELSDQFDLSTQYKHGGLSVTPTLFYAMNQNRQVLVTDAGLGLSYYQGTARTTQYGFELESSFKINESWTLFGTGTLAAETYDNDTPVLTGGAALRTKGKQIPNAPNTMLKGGVTYQIGDLTLTPVVRYVGKRYGDSVEAQPVDDYYLINFNAAYNFGLGHDVKLELNATNLLNKRYIAQISPNDFNQNGATSYATGAPLTIVTSLSASF